MIKSSILASIFVLTVMLSGYCLLRKSPERELIHYRYRVNKIVRDDSREAILQEKLQHAKNPFMEMVELGGLYLGEAKWTQDETYYRKAQKLAEGSLKLSPNNEGALLLLTEIYQAEHRFDEASAILEKMVKQEIGGSTTYGLLATIYLAQGKNIEAFRYAQRLVNYKPFSSNIAMRALTLAALGRNQEAEYDFKKALEVEDFGEPRESAWLRAVYGRYLFQHEQYNLADYALKESLRIVPNYSLALDLLAELYQQKGDYEEARKWAERSFAVLPQVHSLRTLAEIELALGNKDAGYKLLGEAEHSARADLREGRFGHQLELVRTLLDSGDPQRIKEAATLAESEIRIRKSSEAWYWLAKAHLANQQLQAASEAAWEMLNTGEKRKTYLDLMATIEGRLGRPARAKLYSDLGRAL